MPIDNKRLPKRKNVILGRKFLIKIEKKKAQQR